MIRFWLTWVSWCSGRELGVSRFAVRFIVVSQWRYHLQSEQIQPQNLNYSSTYILDEVSLPWDRFCPFEVPNLLCNPMSRWDMRTSLVWSSWAFGPSQPWTSDKNTPLSLKQCWEMFLWRFQILWDSGWNVLDSSITWNIRMLVLEAAWNYWT